VETEITAVALLLLAQITAAIVTKNNMAIPLVHPIFLNIFSTTAAFVVTHCLLN